LIYLTDYIINYSLLEWDWQTICQFW